MSKTSSRITATVCAASAAITVGASVAGASPAPVQPTAVQTTAGQNVDAHDGSVERFGASLYWYGSSETCGWIYNRPNGTAPCGLNIYRSTTLGGWQLVAHELTGSRWAYLCRATTVGTWNPPPPKGAGGTDGCWEPRVLYDAQTRRYVMWLLTTGGRYRVLESRSPVGPFSLVGGGRVGERGYMGDFDLFTYRGAAFIAYSSDMDRHIRVQALAPNDLDATGRPISTGAVGEGTSTFVRDGRVYLVYGPLCAACSTGVAAKYVTSSAPLGRYSRPHELPGSQGQPVDVSQTGNGFLLQTDLWADDPEVSGYFWAYLSFSRDGGIRDVPA